VSLWGCQDQPSTQQLEAWRQEAAAENVRLTQAYADGSQKRQWSLVIEGQTKNGNTTQLSLEQLTALATAHVPTREPHQNSTDAIFDFQGVLVSTLLEKSGIAADANEVTFVAFDAYRVPVSVADLRRYPILLAMQKNGQPIPRSQGGPLYLIFPISQYPELRPKYPNTMWAFYVTNLVIGDEPIHLKIGQQQLKTEDLERSPQTLINTAVGYRLFWPSGNIRLQGVRIQDALAAAGITLPANGSVIVRGKAPIHHDRAKPLRLSVAHLKACDIVLATRWGEELQPIPSRMGGPVTLAFAPNCPVETGKNQPWMTYIEELEVLP
jgi:hypothetical protein